MPFDVAPQIPISAQPSAMPDWAMPGRGGDARRRARRGRQAFLSGLAAEDAVARDYVRGGAQVLARRHRTPHGEIDLIAQDGDVLVFVEVKRRKRLHGFDSPISANQWNRLEYAALHYMVEYCDVTRTQPVCRFDAALVGPDGQIQIIQNARTFD